VTICRSRAVERHSPRSAAEWEAERTWQKRWGSKSYFPIQFKMQCSNLSRGRLRRQTWPTT